MCETQGMESTGYGQGQCCQSMNGRRWKPHHRVLLVRCTTTHIYIRNNKPLSFPAYANTSLHSSQDGDCPSVLCSPLESLQLAYVRSDPTLSVKAVFEVLEQAEAACCVVTVWSLCALRCKIAGLVQVPVQHSPAAKGNMGEVEQP